MDLYTCTSIVGAYEIHDNTENALKCIKILTIFCAIAYI